MNILLWVVQSFLAFLFLSGGATKVFKIDDLLKMPAMKALPRGAWRGIGVLEMVGAVLLVVPTATAWLPDLTPITAGVLAVESLALAALYGRYSLKVAASNPLVWSVLMAVLSVVVAYGRYV